MQGGGGGRELLALFFAAAAAPHAPGRLRTPFEDAERENGKDKHGSIPETVLYLYARRSPASEYYLRFFCGSAACAAAQNVLNGCDCRPKMRGTEAKRPNF